MTKNVESLLDTESKRGGVGYGIEQFAKGLVHASVESPVNALLQIGSKAVYSEHVPKLTLTGAPNADSYAGMAGSIAGSAIDFYLLNKVAAPVFDKIGLSGVSTGVQIGRMAVTGAVYEGILTPSSSDSANFFSDRLKAGAVGAGTFALMGLSAAAVDKLPLFAVPEARSLMGSIGYGALTGSIAGAGRAEINSLIKEQRFASGYEILSDATQYGLFGGTFGALSYAQNAHAHIARQKADGRPTAFESDKKFKVLDIKRDAHGDVVKAVISRPSYQSSYRQMTETLTKMTNGAWSTTAKFDFNGLRAQKLIPGSAVNQMPDGTLAILREGGYGQFLSVFKPNKQGYVAQHFDKPGFDPTMVKHAEGSYAIDKNGYREYDNNKLEVLHQKSGQSASVRYDSNNVSQVRLSDKFGERTLSFSAENGSWYVRDGSSYTYDFKGKISIATDASKRGIVEFRGADGTVKALKPEQPISDLITDLTKSMRLKDGPTALSVVNVDKQGKMMITEPTAMFRPVINGHALEGTREIKPGDIIRLTNDIGDRSPEIVRRILPWGKTANGMPTLDGKILEPGSRHQFELPKANNNNPRALELAPLLKN